MYRRILLVYDGTLEGRTALREGALLAKHYNARIFLLSVGAVALGAETAYPGAAALQETSFRTIFEEAMARLREFGFDPVGRLVPGNPIEEVGLFAKEIEADLVVIGYRRRNAIERWLRESAESLLADTVHCSIVIARNAISDEEFYTVFNHPAAHNG